MLIYWYSICFSPSDLPHSVWHSLGPSTSLQMTQFHSFYGWAMEKALKTHSSTLTWKIPWMEEPGGLQTMGSIRAGHGWVTSLSLFTFMYWRRKWQPTPMFLPGESQEWWAAVCGVAQSQTRLTWLSSSSSNILLYIGTTSSLIHSSVDERLMLPVWWYHSCAVNFI